MSGAIILLLTQEENSVLPSSKSRKSLVSLPSAQSAGVPDIESNSGIPTKKL